MASVSRWLESKLEAQGKCNEDQGGQTHKECILGFYKAVLLMPE